MTMSSLHLANWFWSDKYTLTFLSIKMSDGCLYDVKFFVLLPIETNFSTSACTKWQKQTKLFHWPHFAIKICILFRLLEAATQTPPTLKTKTMLQTYYIAIKQSTFFDIICALQITSMRRLMIAFVLGNDASA